MTAAAAAAMQTCAISPRARFSPHRGGWALLAAACLCACALFLVHRGGGVGEGGRERGGRLRGRLVPQERPGAQAEHPPAPERGHDGRDGRAGSTAAAAAAAAAAAGGPVDGAAAEAAAAAARQEQLEREAMLEAIAAPRMGLNGEDRSAPSDREGTGAGRKDDLKLKPKRHRRRQRRPAPHRGRAAADADAHVADAHAASANSAANSAANAAEGAPRWVRVGGFVPSDEWQAVPEGVAIPGGLHVQMDLQTARKMARIMRDKPGFVPASERLLERRWRLETAARAGRHTTARCGTSKGQVVMQLRFDWAPIGAMRLLELIEDG